jgi:hypothetical protein
LEQVAAPPDLLGTALRRTVLAEQRAQAPRTWLWTVAAATSILVLAFAGYAAGSSIAASGALDLFEALLEDLSVVVIAPSDVLDAVAEVLPWWSLLLAGLGGTVFVWATSELRGVRSGRLRRAVI